MKKLYFVLLFCAVSGISFAQLKVASTGKVGINVGASTPVSNLSVNSVGDANTSFYIKGARNVIWAERYGTPGGSWLHSVVGNAPVTSNYYNVGLRGQSYFANANSGRAWGVLGIAGNSSNGYNYGVFGTTYGSQNGAGIVGTTNNDLDVTISGVYAGYFDGDVKVTGLINGVTVGSSDFRLKENVTELDAAAAATTGMSTLENVLQMKPIEYNLKQQYSESIGDSATVKHALYDEDSQLFQKKHYGLIAQELQELYPDLVYEGDDGYLGINYTGIIPLLIQSIKELKAEVETIENNCCNSSDNLKIGSLLEENSTNTNLKSAKLYQNAPNPFSLQTTIKYEIPESVQSAQLHICNMNGVLIRTIDINQKGIGEILIGANEFSAGMYLYSLVCDDSIIDTKQMLLTK